MAVDAAVSVDVVVSAELLEVEEELHAITDVIAKPNTKIFLM
jgi:hypothetical protein